MYWLNKIVWCLLNPTIVGFSCAIFGLVLLRRCRLGRWLLVSSVVFLWLWASPVLTRMLGLPLEREWLVNGKVPRVEQFSAADAIVLLGGGMGGATNVSDYAEMTPSSDRVWQAARLYRAGKAPRIICTGKGNEATTKGLLMDFGVPTNAMAFADEARNTEEEARAIAQEVEVGGLGLRRNFRILLVTSAWHMRRAKMMFEKYARELDVVPAPADFEATVAFSSGFSLKELIPNGLALISNECFFHEWLGYWAYKYFR